MVGHYIRGIRNRNGKPSGSRPGGQWPIHYEFEFLSTPSASINVLVLPPDFQNNVEVDVYNQIDYVIVLAWLKRRPSSERLRQRIPTLKHHRILRVELDIKFERIIGTKPLVFASLEWLWVPDQTLFVSRNQMTSNISRCVMNRLDSEWDDMETVVRRPCPKLPSMS
jgi:hypothetical protein